VPSTKKTLFGAQSRTRYTLSLSSRGQSRIGPSESVGGCHMAHERGSLGGDIKIWRSGMASRREKPVLWKSVPSFGKSRGRPGAQRKQGPPGARCSRQCVSVCAGCYDKLPPPGGVNNSNAFSQDSGGQKTKVKVSAGLASSGASLLASFPSVCECVFASVSYKDTSHIGIESTLSLHLINYSRRLTV
jgi:hypothetical protein